MPEVVASPPVLRQVLANLLGNAVKFVPPGERLTVRVWAEPARPGQGQEQGRVRLWVEDNGIGIAREHRERIFQVFQRLHGVADYPGTGIGLAIVRKGIERLGGAVGLESEPGGGSRFWIDLPITDAS
jgi:signal transduction histidine kinase